MALKSLQYNHKTFNISYEILNPTASHDIVFLHGWGSNKELMKSSFKDELKAFRHIYIDLPGFGNSTCNNVMTTHCYAQVIDTFLEEINVSKEIILGHSFGGKVALLLQPKLLVLVASAGIQLPKSVKIKAKIILTKIFNLFGLSKFRKHLVADDAKSLSENMYKTFKNVVNEDFSFEFSSFSNKALLFWGTTDSATPIKCATKMSELLKNSTLKTYEGDHYFFMKYHHDIAQEIENSIIKRSL
ncbi:MAG: alpha/beta fold hydrolase [Helicobacteraceae bacterium]|nr:alpha/beta fold hydrolase [Helicobacteraceae bacterium]